MYIYTRQSSSSLGRTGISRLQHLDNYVRSSFINIDPPSPKAIMQPVPSASSDPPPFVPDDDSVRLVGFAAGVCSGLTKLAVRLRVFLSADFSSHRLYLAHAMLAVVNRRRSVIPYFLRPFHSTVNWLTDLGMFFCSTP